MASPLEPLQIGAQVVVARHGDGQAGVTNGDHLGSGARLADSQDGPHPFGTPCLSRQKLKNGKVIEHYQLAESEAPPSSPELIPGRWAGRAWRHSALGS